MTTMTRREAMATEFMATFLQGAVLPTKADQDEALPMVAKLACEAADHLIYALDNSRKSIWG